MKEINCLMNISRMPKLYVDSPLEIIVKKIIRDRDMH